MSFPQKTPGPFRGSGPISFLAFVALPIIAFTIGWQAAETKYVDQTPKTEFTDQGNVSIGDNEVQNIDISLLRDAIDIIREKYVEPDEIDPEQMKYGLVRGVIWSLDDPYSEFMSPEESIEFEDELGGDLQGIGAELTIRDGVIVVITPLKDSPAKKAGLLPEDIILEVDGEVAEGSEFLNVVKRIRGEKGTSVTLTIYRPDTGERLEIDIVRDAIRVETVELSFDEDIAIIEVNQFGTNTEQEFATALSDALVENPKGIILDLRFNSGGFLDTAVNMVSAFIKSGKVVIQKGRPPNTESKFVSGNVKTDLPLVVLQNSGSASASEIVSGALQDVDRALIVGEKSFGKGTVQELIPMQNGAHLRLTVAKWLTPGGRDIGKVGIEPDLHVERTSEEIANDEDPQLEAALRYLRGDTLDELIEEYGNLADKLQNGDYENDAEKE